MPPHRIVLKPRPEEQADAGGAPLGVLPAVGAWPQIDNQDVGRAGFVRCLPNGCVAEVVMDDSC